jgi:hypothetical protein
MRSARNSQASEASIAVDLAPTFLSATPPSIQEIPYNCQSQSYASSFQTNATSILDDERLSLLKQAVQNVQYYTPQIEVVRTVFDDFTDFIRQGNMIDLAVGLILGKAFTDILNSFVVDILTPILSLFSGKYMLDSLYYILWYSLRKMV